MTVQEGDTAPEFQMPASGGRTVSLAALKGKKLLSRFESDYFARLLLGTSKFTSQGSTRRRRRPRRL